MPSIKIKAGSNLDLISTHHRLIIFAGERPLVIVNGERQSINARDFCFVPSGCTAVLASRSSLVCIEVLIDPTLQRTTTFLRSILQYQTQKIVKALPSATFHFGTVIDLLVNFDKRLIVEAVGKELITRMAANISANNKMKLYRRIYFGEELDHAMEICHIIHKELTVPRLAAQLKISRTTLWRRSRHLYSLSTAAILSQWRYRYAILILLTSEETITNIAKQAGYVNEKYFMTLVKKKSGVTCEELRRINGRDK